MVAYCGCEKPEKTYGNLDDPYCKKCGFWIGGAEKIEAKKTIKKKKHATSFKPILKEDNLVQCPECGKTLRIQRNKTGKVRCQCKHVFAVKKGVRR